MSTYRFGKFALDTGRRMLQSDRKEEQLSAKLYDLLLCFIKSGGRPISKDDVAAHVWPGDEPSDATIVQHVMLLRKVLGDNAKPREYVLTVPRRGYAFVPAVYCDAPAVSRSTHVSANTTASVLREYLAAEQFCLDGEVGSSNALRQALKHYQAALKLNPNFAPAWNGVASMYSFMAYYAHAPWSSVLEGALRATSRAIELDPHSALACCLHSQLHFVQWELAESLRLVEEAAELDPQSPDPYHLSAFIRIWCGDFETAAADAKRSLALDPSNVLTQVAYAKSLAGQGDLPSAIAIYTNVLEAHPSNHVTREARCEAYAGGGQLHLALRDLKQLPRSSANASRLGCVYALSGNRPAAMQLLAELQRKSSTEYMEPHCIAQLHIALGHYDEAVSLAGDAIKAHDLKFPAMLKSPLLARPMRDKRLRGALSDFGAFLRKGPKIAGSRFYVLPGA